jgi:hypothetical protein
MDIIDKITEVTGLGFEDLKGAERETVMNWINAIDSREISLDGVRTFINGMRVAVDTELAVDNLSKKRDLYLKARLKNLIALEAYLEGPEKAKRALELYLNKLKK